MNDFSHVTTVAAVETYTATNGVFVGLIAEVRELSKKKPDATLSKSKVSLINRVLVDLKSFLDKEPEGKFLDLLDDQDLPQTSDAVLVMVQFETALRAFNSRYFKVVTFAYNDKRHAWITPELIATLKKRKGGSAEGEISTR